MTSKPLFRYKVVSSESPVYPVGMVFDTHQKLHDGRTKRGQLADVNCLIWEVQLEMS